MRFFCRVVVAASFGLFCAVLFGGCDRADQAGTGSPPAELTVAAASDLQAAFSEIARQFEEKRDCKVRITFGSTGQFAQQIEHGAPFDVFAAANVAYVDKLAARQRIIPGTTRVYARGRIVLAVSKSTGVAATRLDDLAGSGIRHVAIANPAHAPYGLAAKQALERAGLWEQVQPKLVMGENVRQTLQFVETGNADAGIVALSVADVPGISFTAIDAALHDPIDQAIAVVADTKNEPLAREFITLVTGADGRAILEKFGFEMPE